MGETLSEIGDLVFSLVIGYLGALEVLYVARHLYHWSCHGPMGEDNDADDLNQLQERMRNQISDAEAREQLAGDKAMQDGVLYKDGFRIDPQQADIDHLKEQQKTQEAKEERRKEIEAELAKQKKIEEETRKQLEKAEAELALQRKEAEEAAIRKQEAEDEEIVRKLLEAERAREAEQRKLEERKEAEENERKLLEAEKQREEEQRRKEEEEENERKLLEAEKQREEEQRRREEEEENERKRRMEEEEDNEKRIFEAARQYEAEQRQLEEDEREAAEQSQRLLEAERSNELREQQHELAEEDEEAAEQSRLLIENERERERKQKLIEENARKFLEAEQEMVDLQQQMEEAVQQRQYSVNAESAPQTPVIEEPCIKKTVAPQFAATDNERLKPTVKTQLGQTSKELYSHTSKSLLFPDVSDEGSSIEPNSSKQPSEEVTTGAEEVAKAIAMQFPQLERQEPDGEDNIPPVQYTDDYLRSLDGIKHKPLVREDGSGRRRAFKKRRSSGSSNSSRESRTSREEELKMFTSLEEEEMQSARSGNADYEPIKYPSESNLKVKGHHRRHKRSPAKDMKTSEESLRSSLEMLDEENGNPWGEVVPGHYKDTAFWKREKAMSIDEEEIEFERPAEGGKAKAGAEDEAEGAATNIPKTSSFEEATDTQNEEAISVLQTQLSKEEAGEKEETKTIKEDNARSDTKTNLQTSQNTEADKSSPARSSASPRLRRSPRIDEIDQYEERWKETESSKSPTQPSVTSPTIRIHEAVDNDPWRDEHGLMMQGLSDFYDFTASVNPSRSRSTSRNPSPANSQPTSPIPKNVSNTFNEGASSSAVDVYDDTGNLVECEFAKENITDFIDSLNGETSSSRSSSFNWVEEVEKEIDEENVVEECVTTAGNESSSIALQNVADDPNRNDSSENIKVEVLPMIYVDTTEEDSQGSSVSERSNEMNVLVQSLRAERCRSRSRSRSPLPTTDNIQRSLEARANKRIKHNNEVFEKLSHSSRSPESNQKETSEVKEADERYRAERSSSRSVSRSRSPLPTADNIQRSLETRRNRLIQHNDEIFEKLNEQLASPVRDLPSPIEINISEAPTISIELAESSQSSTTEDVECSRENMSSLVESLRLARSRSRSKSPMRIPSAQNLERSVESRRSKLIERNDEIFEQLLERAKTPEPPRITVEYVYQVEGDPEEKCENTTAERGRSRSRTPSRSRSASPHGRRGIPENVSYSPDLEYKFEDRPITQPNFEYTDMETKQAMQNISDCYDFHMMLNLEASQNRTLSKNSEEYESSLAQKQRLLDDEALHTLKTANEETELRTLTPNAMDSYAGSNETSDNEETDSVGDMPIQERLRLLRCSPTTPEYERSISEEWRDVQRIKKDRLASGLKRSTYVGESMDLGSEFEPLRIEAARFQRSQSPSPSIDESELKESRQSAGERRLIQDQILAELTASSDQNKLGAKPKTERKSSAEGERSISMEVLDTQRIKDDLLTSGFKRSTYVGESVDLSSLRRETADFRRSRSKSRSPLDDEEVKEIEKIEAEVAKRELQDKILDEIAKTTINFQDFSRNLNVDFLDNDRRASDSALMQKPEMLFQLQGTESEFDIDPEEYHHYRRFSLNQEEPVEEYPNDDFVCVSQIEVRTLTGTRTWIREDFYSDEFQKITFSDSEEPSEEVSIEMLNENEEQARDEEDSEGSDDERQTIVEVEDEIDEDICDFNPRSADESHHEQSECEEADREMDRYAGRGANDWEEVEQVDQDIDGEYSDEVPEGEDEGAVGGATYDSDSFAIDQIYDEAIKNRKQSGILRDFDSILQDMQNNYLDNSSGKSDSNTDITSVKDRYDLWAKTRSLERPPSKPKTPNGVESSLSFIENERRDNEIRYLGDASMTARQSTRLRSRYGYGPALQSNSADNIEVDINYTPKREYNWRKNFKLEDEEQKENLSNEEYLLDGNENSEDLGANGQYLDLRKFSLGGESITLFSQSPERELLEQVLEDTSMDADPEEDGDEAVRKNFTEEIPNETAKEKPDKPKKKKSKKKTRKETKSNIEIDNKDDDDDSEGQMYSRRSSSLQMETDSPKRKSHSRRSSKSSLTNEENATLFSPRSSVVGNGEPIYDITEEYGETTVPLKKKTKKRKKAKESFAQEAKIKEEYQSDLIAERHTELNPPEPVSTTISPESSSAYLLATLSPQNSVCVTPASIESETSERPLKPLTVPKSESKSTPATTSTTTVTSSTTTTSTPTPTTSTPVDSFDILKDANFYPLF